VFFDRIFCSTFVNYARRPGDLSRGHRRSWHRRSAGAILSVAIVAPASPATAAARQLSGKRFPVRLDRRHPGLHRGGIQPSVRVETSGSFGQPVAILRSASPPGDALE
jgi:hypothetical protein